MPHTAHLRDLSEEELRAAGPAKWSLDGPGVIPAWVAEMDFALAEPIHQVVREYAARGVFGYAGIRDAPWVAQALADFSRQRWGHVIDSALVTVIGDVMEGMSLTIREVAPPGPVIVPTPVYVPFLELSRACGRDIRPVPLVRAGGRLTLDLDAIERQAQDGARTLLLCHPHNPVGRCYDRAELSALAEVIERWGVHVISDEIHSPLTWPGVDFVPYAAIAHPDAALTTLMSATKAFTMPGLRCAQLISHRAGDHHVLRALHPVLNHSMTTLGQRATIAAYTSGQLWLDLVRTRVAQNHALFTAGMNEAVPHVQVEPAEATYLAWLDVGDVAVADPAAAALVHGVRVDGQGAAYGPGGHGRVRVNLATSTARLTEIVRRLARAWHDPR